MIGVKQHLSATAHVFTFITPQSSQDKQPEKDTWKALFFLLVLQCDSSSVQRGGTLFFFFYFFGGLSLESASVPCEALGTIGPLQVWTSGFVKV